LVIRPAAVKHCLKRLVAVLDAGPCREVCLDGSDLLLEQGQEPVEEVRLSVFRWVLGSVMS
jgi:hypothetical protein